MHLTELQIRNFRCLAAVELEPGPAINAIVGRNASGKSSLLEAVHYLGRAQSFRGTPADRLIRHGENQLSIFGRIAGEDGPWTLGVQRIAHETRIRLNTEDNAGIQQLVAALPLQSIDPRLHQLLEEGPEQRRRYLDWGVFHVEHSFYPAWRRYQRVLRQRNQALRLGSARELVCAWDAEYAGAAREIDRMRRTYLAALLPELSRQIAALLPAAEVEFEFSPGWPQDQPLEELLSRAIERDREQGYTQQGAHRADLRIRLAGRLARSQASRGEQKLLSAAMLLAQARLLHQQRGKTPILLIDDLAAELDVASRQALFGAIAGLGAQCFLSFLEAAQIPQHGHVIRMFHVEHGRVSTLPA